MKKYLMEGLGTFILVLVLTLVIQNGVAYTEPVAYGAILIALTLAGGSVSGAHFNPAVSLANLICNKLERWDAPYYTLAQLAGGLLAALIAAFLIRCQANPEVILRAFDPFCAFFAEALGAFFLCFTYLMASNQQPGSGNLNLSMAVGFSVIAGNFAFYPLSAATFNPVIAMSMALAGNIAWGDVWVCLAGAFLGASAAASVYRGAFNTPD